MGRVIRVLYPADGPVELVGRVRFGWMVGGLLVGILGFITKLRVGGVAL